MNENRWGGVYGHLWTVFGEGGVACISHLQCGVTGRSPVLEGLARHALADVPHSAAALNSGASDLA